MQILCSKCDTFLYRFGYLFKRLNGISYLSLSVKIRNPLLKREFYGRIMLFRFGIPLHKVQLQKEEE